MKIAPATLSAFLAASSSVVQTDLYTFSLIGGQVLRYTGGAVALTLPAAAMADPNSLNYGAAQTFLLGPRFGRSKVSSKVGIEPSELDIQILAGSHDLVGNLPFAEALRLGFFDGATVELDRLFGTTATDTARGAVIWFYGRVAEADIGRSAIDLKVKSLLDLMAIHQFPRRIYQSSCTHVFGDKMCGYDRTGGKNALGQATGFGAVAIAAAPQTTQTLIWSSVPLKSQYQEGTITGASGANLGITRTIGAIDTTRNTAALLLPFP